MFRERWSRPWNPDESLSRPEHTKLAAFLARKAHEDATAVREFAGNPEISDGILGFHAQQAIEKWIKAVMAARGLDSVQGVRLSSVGSGTNFGTKFSADHLNLGHNVCLEPFAIGG